MKFNDFYSFSPHKGEIRKMFLIMKFTAIILLGTCLQVSASGFAQKVSISEKNVSLQQIFKEIHRQTGYQFFYQDELLDKAGKIDVKIKNASLEDALKECLKNLPLEFSIVNGTIVVKSKPVKEPVISNLLVPEPPAPKITGTVRDEKGLALPGASVLIKGTTKGTVTDTEGNFSIEGKIGDVLVISYLGFEPQELKVSVLNGITISLRAKISSLDELIIVGYTRKKISELTGSVQSVSGKEINNSITTPDAISALKGRITGVDILNSNPNTGAKAAIIVRGQSSFSGGVDPINGAFNDAIYVETGPLIVIDGVITQFTSISQAVSMNDIEEVTLLKDAASTAVYGSRAAAGVLLVTTKRGEIGRQKINVTLRSGFNYPNFGNIDMMNTSQWLQYTRDAASISWAQVPSYKTQFPNGYLDLWKNKMQGMFSLFDTTFSFDWQHNVFKPGILKNAMVNVSGGNDKSNYYVGFSTYNESGNDYISKYAQNNVRIKLEQKFTRFFTAGMNVSGNFENMTNPYSSAEAVVNYLPFYNPYKKGSYSDSAVLPRWRGPGTTAAAGALRTSGNPFFENQYNNTLINNSNLMGSFWGKITFTPWLDFTSTNTWSKFKSESNNVADRRTVSGGYLQASNMKGRLTINSTENDVFLTSNQLNFRKTVQKNHNISALLGQEYQYKKLLTESITKYDVLAGERNPSAGATDTYSSAHTMATGLEREYLIYSLFSQVDYSFKDKYLFSGSARRDGSASFSPQSRYKNFWSLSGGWAVSRENFWEPIRNVVSFLKFRGSYGISGKDAGADFLNQTLYRRTGNNPPSDYLELGNQGYFLYQLGNESLTWETTLATEMGVDMELFKGRVNASFSYYNKAGKDLLLRAQYTSTSGVPAQYQNIGDLTNKGWELTLKTLNVTRKDFSWSTAFTAYHNTNRIDKIRPPVFSGDVPELSVSSTIMTYGYTGNYKVGESLNDIKVVKFLRFNQDNGYPVFEHVSDADGTKSEVTLTPSTSFSNLLGNPASFQKIGTAVPKIQGGFINEFKYKNFGLGITMTYGFGSTVLNKGLSATMRTPYGTYWTSYDAPVYTRNLVYWKPGSPDNAEVNTIGPGFQFPTISPDQYSLLWISGDAVKIANIRFSYDLPGSLLKKLKLSSFQVVLSADNIKYFTNKYYLGSDPEAVTYQGSGNDTGGTGALNYSYGYVASPKRVNLTFNIGF